MATHRRPRVDGHPRPLQDRRPLEGHDYPWCENIYPREIEQVLFDHDDVADVAVVGVPDTTWGEQVAAFVRPAEGRTPDPDQLYAYCRDRLAPHKTPRHWIVVDDFPLTPSGNVQKYVLRETFLAAAPTRTSGG